MQFHHVVCGGTFDHLHVGHKKLLNECLRQGERVTVGITNRAMVRHKAYIYSLQSYGTRVKNVTQFDKSLSILRLQDIYGTTLTDATIDAICVTQDTHIGAEQINLKRKELGMAPLSILLVPFVLDENGERISSERIRQGIINREGIRYDTYLFSKEKHILPDSLRQALRKPLGRTISSFSSLSKHQMEKIRDNMTKRGQFYLCSIGDMMTLELEKLGISSLISVIDGITQRKALNIEIFNAILEKDRYNALNEKGTIQKNAYIMVQKLFDMGHKGAIKQLYVHGEEDLLTLVAVLFAPLGAHVWYGQQEVGAVDIRVTEKKKQTVYNLLRQFN